MTTILSDYFRDRVREHRDYAEVYSERLQSHRRANEKADSTGTGKGKRPGPAPPCVRQDKLLNVLEYDTHERNAKEHERLTAEAQTLLAEALRLEALDD